MVSLNGSSEKCKLVPQKTQKATAAEIGTRKHEAQTTTSQTTIPPNTPHHPCIQRNQIVLTIAMVTPSTFKFELDRLPREITTQILSYLPRSSLLALSQTNGALRDLIYFHPIFHTHPNNLPSPSKPHKLWEDLSHIIGEPDVLDVYTEHGVQIDIYDNEILREPAVLPPLKSLVVRLVDKDPGLEVVGTGRRGIVMIKDVIHAVDENHGKLGEEGNCFLRGLHHCQGRVYSIDWETDSD
jgi:hypothetical protein